MDRFRLIIFDWDGTIADSLPHIVNAMKSAISAVQLPTRTAEEILDVTGLGLQEAVTGLFPGIETAVSNCLIDHYRKYYLEYTAEKTQLFPKVENTLQTLSDEGYMLAIATGKSRKGLERSIKNSGIKHYFHTSRCADETVSKPHPRMLYEIMNSVGITARETIMVGDSRYDLQMAASANVASVAVGYGAQPLHSLRELNPLTCLDCISKLPGWLGTQQSTAAIPG